MWFFSSNYLLMILFYRVHIVPSKYAMSVMIFIMMISFYYFSRHVRFTSLFLSVGSFFCSLTNGDFTIIHYDFLSCVSRIFGPYPGHTFPYNESVRTGTLKLQNDIKAP